jgi:cell wall assembly regulator SMI1
VTKRGRTIGTTVGALDRAEAELGLSLPASFREWLLAHNGTGLEGVTIFPILDDRDPRKTWDSIIRHRSLWQSYCSDVFDSQDRFQTLLPFAEFGTGDYYCFDYSVEGDAGEPVVVHWSHETGMSSPRASSFTDFRARLAAGEFDGD